MNTICRNVYNTVYTSRSVGDVVSFRPDDEEARIIERTRVELGLKTRADALRHLIREGGKKRRLSEEPVFKLRLGKGGPSLTSEEIDRIVYGD